MDSHLAKTIQEIKRQIDDLYREQMQLDDKYESLQDFVITSLNALQPPQQPPQGQQRRTY